jgi:lipoprotein-anchoring transpeptidase ErfK/SrfK
MKLVPYLFLAVIALLAAACGGSRESEVAGTSAERCTAGSIEPMRSQQRAYAGVLRFSTRAYRTPGRGIIARLEPKNVNGHVTVLGVLSAVRWADCKPRWYRVQLPRKPNGITGYVRAVSVDLIPVRTRIVVDLSERRITLFRRGTKVLETVAAVGSDSTPTPTGSFYVDQRLIPSDPSGPFGPGAVGIAAYSEVLTGWTQGGPIAIHGTNKPWLIGQAVSNGCLRVRNPVLRRIFAAALPGTPVTIRT